MSKQKFTKVQLEHRRKNARDNYAKNNDEINRKRRITKIITSRKKFASKTIVRKKRHNTSIRIRNSFKIGVGNRITIRCPIHKNESLHRLIYNTAIQKRPTRKNKRGIAGSRGITNWFFCEKCDLPRQVKLIISEG